jgi:hypothetical protein
MGYQEVTGTHFDFRFLLENAAEGWKLLKQLQGGT